MRLPHAVVLNRLRWQWRQFPFGAEEALCVFKTALTFVDSVPEVWGPLLQGRALLVLDKAVTADTERLVHALQDNGVSTSTERGFALSSGLESPACPWSRRASMAASAAKKRGEGKQAT